MLTTNIYFLNPFFGIIIFIIGLFFLYFFYVKQTPIKKFKFSSDIEKVYGRINFTQKIKIFILFIILGIFSLIIANPVTYDYKLQKSKGGVDLLFVLDLSLSMRAADLTPSRFESARDMMMQTISKLKTERVGLLYSAGIPLKGFSLTKDYEFALKKIKESNIDSINQTIREFQGNDTGGALLYGSEMFDNPNRKKIILMFTDGEVNKVNDDYVSENKEEVVQLEDHLLKIVKYLKEKNIKVYNIGFGGKEEIDITINFPNELPEKLPVGGLFGDNLKKISEITEGNYYEVGNDKMKKGVFEKLIKDLEFLRKDRFDKEYKLILTPYYYPFVLILLLFIALHLFFSLFYYIRK